MAFHLQRETGKIIRIVSKGSVAFGQVLRFTFFNIVPIVLEVVFVVAAIAYMFPIKFFWLNFGCIILYFFVTIYCTEWRAKYFKEMTKRDNESNQRATDSLLNFETVKYFNAEDHEQTRFYASLWAYKNANVIVANSLVALNMSQTIVITLSLTYTLLLAY